MRQKPLILAVAAVSMLSACMSPTPAKDPALVESARNNLIAMAGPLLAENAAAAADCVVAASTEDELRAIAAAKTRDALDAALEPVVVREEVRDCAREAMKVRQS